MTIAHAMIGFALVVGLLTIVPGIDTTLVLRSAVTRRASYAWATAIGISTGTLVWGIAAAAGATVILAASATAYRIVSMAGALYLTGMGISFLIRSFRSPTTESMTLPEPTGGLWRGWCIGLTTNLLNPKVGVFYLATIPHFIPEGVSPLLMGMVLAFVHIVLNMVWSGIVIVAGIALGRHMQSPGFLRWLDRVTGGVLLAFGVKLALTQP